MKEHWGSVACRLADRARLNLQKRAALMSPSLLRNLHGKTPTLRSKSGLAASLQRPGQRSAMSPAAHRLASSLRSRGDTPADREVNDNNSSSLLAVAAKSAVVGCSSPSLLSWSWLVCCSYEPATAGAP